MVPVTPQMKEKMGSSPYALRQAFRLVELSEGYAKVAVNYTKEYTNFLGVVDGGLIMSLADYAFACSCNSFGQVRVAGQFSTNFISGPSAEGELIAEGKTIHAGKTMALTQITVKDVKGKLIATATGTAITINNK